MEQYVDMMATDVSLRTVSTHISEKETYCMPAPSNNSICSGGSSSGSNCTIDDADNTSCDINCTASETPTDDVTTKDSENLESVDETNEEVTSGELAQLTAVETSKNDAIDASSNLLLTLDQRDVALVEYLLSENLVVPPRNDADPEVEEQSDPANAAEAAAQSTASRVDSIVEYLKNGDFVAINHVVAGDSGKLPPPIANCPSSSFWDLICTAAADEVADDGDGEFNCSWLTADDGLFILKSAAVVEAAVSGFRSQTYIADAVQTGSAEAAISSPRRIQTKSLAGDIVNQREPSGQMSTIAEDEAAVLNLQMSWNSETCRTISVDEYTRTSQVDSCRGSSVGSPSSSCGCPLSYNVGISSSSSSLSAASVLTEENFTRMDVEGVPDAAAPTITLMRTVPRRSTTTNMTDSTDDDVGKSMHMSLQSWSEDSGIDVLEFIREELGLAVEQPDDFQPVDFRHATCTVSRPSRRNRRIPTAVPKCDAGPDIASAGNSSPCRSSSCCHPAGAEFRHGSPPARRHEKPGSAAAGDRLRNLGEIRRQRGERPYCCTAPGCKWRFSRSDELARHFRSTHSAVRPHACTMCEKRFARSDHLAKHVRVHRKRQLQQQQRFLETGQ